MAGARSRASEGHAEMLYHRDKETGDHVVTVDGCEHRYPTRAAAMAACKQQINRAGRNDAGD